MPALAVFPREAVRSESYFLTQRGFFFPQNLSFRIIFSCPLRYNIVFYISHYFTTGRVREKTRDMEKTTLYGKTLRDMEKTTR